MPPIVSGQQCDIRIRFLQYIFATHLASHFRWLFLSTWAVLSQLKVKNAHISCSRRRPQHKYKPVTAIKQVSADTGLYLLCCFSQSLSCSNWYTSIQVCVQVCLCVGAQVQHSSDSTILSTTEEERSGGQGEKSISVRSDF